MHIVLMLVRAHGPRLTHGKHQRIAATDSLSQKYRSRGIGPPAATGYCLILMSTRLTLLMTSLLAALCCSCSRAQNAQAEDLKTPDLPTVAVVKASVEDISLSP